MKLSIALKDKEMDTRLLDRLLAEGKLSKIDYDQFLTTLEDCEGMYEQAGSTPAAPVTEPTE